MRWTPFIMLVIVQGSEGSAVSKTLTGMQRKGDKFHDRHANRSSCDLDGRKISWRRKTISQDGLSLLQ